MNRYDDHDDTSDDDTDTETVYDPGIEEEDDNLIEDPADTAAVAVAEPEADAEEPAPAPLKATRRGKASLGSAPDPEPDDITNPLEAEGAPPVRYVALGKLYLGHKHWQNPRTQTGLDGAGSDGLEVIATSIKEQTVETVEGTIAGIQVPLEVVMVLDGNGGFINLVIDGQRRVMAANSVLSPDVLVQVIDIEPDPIELNAARSAKLLMRALTAVSTRAGLSSPELADCAIRLRDADMTLSKISAAIGRSESWISKMLKACAQATPSLRLSWNKGDITDEQFKDLAGEKNPVIQKAEAAKVVFARQMGDKTEARVLAKEHKEVAKRDAPKSEAKPVAPAKEGKGKGGKAKPVVSGPQADLPIGSDPTEAPAMKKPSPAVVEDFLGLAEKHPPTHDYVQGLMHGAAWVAGKFDAAGFKAAWVSYQARITGVPVETKAAKNKAVKKDAPKPVKAKKGK